MIWFKKYELFLTEDKRTTEVQYHHFIGSTYSKKPYYIRWVKLWDPLVKKYLRERVLLKSVEYREKIISVEVIKDGMV